MRNIKENWTKLGSSYKVATGVTLNDREPKPYLVVGRPAKPTHPVLDNKLLHRSFARIDPSDIDAIAKFAVKYGFLGEAMAVFPPEGRKQSHWGEPLRLWWQQVIKCSVLLQIWENIQNEDAGKLGQIILWRQNPDVRVLASLHAKRDKNVYRLLPGSLKPTGEMEWSRSRVLADKRTNPHLLERWKFGSVIEPAFVFLCSEINLHLNEQFSYILIPNQERDLCTVPKDLKSLIWLMFSYEIVGRLNPVQCQSCATWFDQEDKREKFCSNACRQRAYRFRKTMEVTNERQHSKER